MVESMRCLAARYLDHCRYETTTTSCRELGEGNECWDVRQLPTKGATSSLEHQHLVVARAIEAGRSCGRRAGQPRINFAPNQRVQGCESACTTGEASGQSGSGAAPRPVDDVAGNENRVLPLLKAPSRVSC